MISFIFKFSITFIFSFIILSFKFDNKALFNHITDLTGPLGTDVQKSFGRSVKHSLSKTKKIGKDFIKNADPRYLKDSIHSQRSSTRRQKDQELILEDIRRDEVRKLDELIQKNAK